MGAPSLGSILSTVGKSVGAAGKAVSEAAGGQPKQFASHPSDPVSGGAGDMSKKDTDGSKSGSGFFEKALRAATGVGKAVSRAAGGGGDSD